MNILFLLKSFEIGGLEVVTTVLANKFLKEGHQVVIWAFSKKIPSLSDRLDSNIAVIYGEGFKLSTNNIKSLRTTLIENNINVVVNQWGLPYIPAYTLKKAAQGFNLKTIAVYHNDPSTNGKIKKVEIEIGKAKNNLQRYVLYSKMWLFKLITSTSMRYIYKNSDLFMVLSQSYVEAFQKFTKLKKINKLVVQTNPITIETNNVNTHFDCKRKEVLYVGRIDYYQKRVSRIIEMWSILEIKFPEWHLSIVGDGPEKNNIERMVEELNLHNVSLEGFQPPQHYYERASLLILASEYEGFPLVIAEAMSFGVVPVVYGSYSAVYDIICDGVDGFIVPKTNDNCVIDLVDKMSEVMSAGNLYKLSLNAIEKSKNYSIEKVYKEWFDKLRMLNIY